MDLSLHLDLEYSGHCFPIRFRVATILTPFLLRDGVTLPALLLALLVLAIFFFFFASARRCRVSLE